MLELDQVAADIVSAHTCIPSFLNYHGFPGRICTSINDVIVHGIPTDYRLVEGDILSLDAGAIFEGYHADAAITFGIGEVSDEANALMDATEQAMWAGIRQVGHEVRLGDIGAAVQAVGEAAGLGVVREYVGHGIGRSMHEKPEVPNYGERGTGMRLKTGMAICIEPMFNVGAAESTVDADGWTVRTADGGLSAHFEHTVALTEDGIKVLTDPNIHDADL
jgi:methionyl aminopeptidase